MPDETPERSRAPARSRLRRLMTLLIGLNMLGALGVLVSLNSSQGVLLVIVLLLYAVLAMVWTAIFSTREEPNRRLVDLITALRGHRRE